MQTAARVEDYKAPPDGGAAPNDRTVNGAAALGSRSVTRRSGGFRRLPPVSAEERRRRAEWGKTWGATMREIVAEHKAQRA